jgi:hypothetical protein
MFGRATRTGQTIPPFVQKTPSPRPAPCPASRTDHALLDADTICDLELANLTCDSPRVYMIFLMVAYS